MFSEKVLVDTNIFIDYLADRKSGYLPIGEFAATFIKRTISCEFKIIICIDIIRELTKILNVPWQELIENEFQLLHERNKLITYHPEKSIRFEANKISQKENIPYIDVLCTLVARKLDIKIVTRDKHFFYELEHHNSFLPEEL